MPYRCRFSLFTQQLTKPLPPTRNPARAKAGVHDHSHVVVRHKIMLIEYSKTHELLPCLTNIPCPNATVRPLRDSSDSPLSNSVAAFPRPNDRLIIENLRHCDDQG